MNHAALILASGSPRRRELLSLTGFPIFSGFQPFFMRKFYPLMHAFTAIFPQNPSAALPRFGVLSRFFNQLSAVFWR